jgi:hypothetical protein
LFVITNPWSLLKYYLLKPEVVEFGHINRQQIDNEHRKAVAEIGTRLYDAYIERGGDRFEKEVLGGFAANRITEYWITKQFEVLHDESEGVFDYNDNWNRLIGESNVYVILDLLRLLFTIKYYNP